MSPPVSALRALLGVSLWMVAASAVPAAEIRIDLGKPAGTLRPLHGVNGGTEAWGETLDLSAGWKEIAVPQARLHDCHYPNPDVVDLHVIFPDPSADPEDPRSYRFAETDEYLRRIIGAGAEPLYRLGESIDHRKTKRWVHPPGDPARWAAACAGIIRHYTQGWAGGFRWKIRRWEIWNEPENRPQMWTGTPEEFFRLYEVASKHLKERFPDLLVGGPAVGDSGRLDGDELLLPGFLRNFLDHVERTGAPLDFFSWHTYTADPAVLSRKAREFRRILDARGFQKTENILDEWNYLPRDDWEPLITRQGKDRVRFYDEITGAPGAAFAAAALLELQDTPLDVGCYYTGDAGWFGLFDVHGTPLKTFHAFRAFRLLLDCPDRVEASGGIPGKLAAAAGLGRGLDRAAALIANFAGPGGPIEVSLTGLPWPGAVVEVLVVDGARELEKVREERIEGREGRLALDLPAPAVALLRIAGGR